MKYYRERLRRGAMVLIGWLIGLTLMIFFVPPTAATIIFLAVVRRFRGRPDPALQGSDELNAESVLELKVTSRYL